jgi:hypothetical protein
MGWTVLYIAFGIVALWLLGEVLLQYKARLRWRLLAFGGFLGVVLGVLIPSVLVIALGAVAFAVGQTYVTLSFRRGFASGWAVSRPGGEEPRRRRGGAGEDAGADGPAAALPGYEATAGYGGGPAGFGDDTDRDDVFSPALARTGQLPAVDPAATGSTSVYEPQPMPDETGTYGVYSSAGYGGTDADRAQDQYATASADQQQYGYEGYDQQQYGYDQSGQQQYAAYSDPYIGTHGAAQTPSYDDGSGYSGSYDGGQQYGGQQGYGQDGYASGGYADTPAGGVWVPQQRGYADQGQDQQYGQQGYDQGQGQGQGQHQGQGYDGQYHASDEQYRF